MKQAIERLSVNTRGKGLTDVTDALIDFVARQEVDMGILTLWCCHTSASLTVQENASADVRRDIVDFFEALVPENDSYEHDDEGPDDMPAHLRTMLTNTHLTIPVQDGRLTLGTWQAVYLFEHRRRPHRREIVLHVLGDVTDPTH
jgi:secondary thiamine-phosphate synthase enzyme